MSWTLEIWLCVVNIMTIVWFNEFFYVAIRSGRTNDEKRNVSIMMNSLGWKVDHVYISIATGLWRNYDPKVSYNNTTCCSEKKNKSMYDNYNDTMDFWSLWGSIRIGAKIQGVAKKGNLGRWSTATKHRWNTPHNG